MRKPTRILAMCLTAIMILSAMCMPAFAAETEEKIQFVETDENGNIIEIGELEYIEEVAEAYANRKLARWPSTSYYNLANGPTTISGGKSAYVMSTKRFNANSSGRLYYHSEVTDKNATLDIYDINTDDYKGSFRLTDQGDGTFSKTGYITGLKTSSSQYYSFGLSCVTSSFSSYYAAISWTSL